MFELEYYLEPEYVNLLNHLVESPFYYAHVIYRGYVHGVLKDVPHSALLLNGIVKIHRQLGLMLQQTRQ